MRWSLLILLFVLACQSDFAPGSLVTKPRLLALAADTPFARPEASVTLRPLLALPTSADTEGVSWAYATCTHPSASSTDGCLAALDGPFQNFELTEAGLSLQLEAADAYAGTRQVGVMLVACPGGIEPGTTDVVPVVCRDASGDKLGLHQFEVGMKRIFVRKDDRNQNPSIEQLTWDGEEWLEGEERQAEVCDDPGDNIDDCPSDLHHKLGIVTSSPERGSDESGTAFEEQQVVQVYSTHGVFEYQVRLANDDNQADNAWVAQRRETDDDLATLWFVVRDDRGGVSWQTRHVRLR